ncbi:SDR family oxidoreductase [Labrenzia sp. 011]|uniref:NAD-dependent epimerase/dehydratase family protein n=1 Tax=Labrenzia sp. 011 TaxID=2171494 RepID=UPI000D516EF9|nr:SDR family oxidoreductase [Labrenzia sp. 011]PVB62261.1 NAD-dependent dehydratase [Labrenzia sp. 011]
MKATVLGASGFIGANIVRHLQGKGYEVATPGRAELAALAGDLGHVFYCVGLTGNFRDHPLATVEAHAGILARLLETVSCESFLYFSSTRIYGQATETAQTGETGPVRVTPSADTTYDLSKMLGEALCLAMEQPAVRVIRLSNVYGADQSPNTFLGSLLRDLATKGHAEFLESAESSKDYVAMTDVATLAERIARSGRQRIYNVASGRATRHGDIAGAVTRAGYSCSFRPGGVRRALPAIDIARIQNEFDFSPRNLIDDLPSLLRAAGGSASHSGVDP